MIGSPGVGNWRGGLNKNELLSSSGNENSAWFRTLSKDVLPKEEHSASKRATTFYSYLGKLRIVTLPVFI